MIQSSKLFNQRKFNIVVPYVLIIVGFLTVYTRIVSGGNITRESLARSRINNCILSKNAVSRDQSDIENCYRAVQRDMDINLKRYDKEL